MKTVALVVLAACGAGAMEPVGYTLDTLKRVYVDSLGQSSQAVMLRDMVISSLAGSGLFAITENADHADAILRGSADDQIYVEQHHSSDSLTAGIHGGSSDNYTSKYDHTSTAKQSGLSIGQNESSQSSERKHEASASVRLVNRNGDVIWSTTQESLGARFRSSSADVADKILRKLTDDVQRLRATSSADSASIHAGMPAR